MATERTSTENARAIAATRTKLVFFIQAALLTIAAASTVLGLREIAKLRTLSEWVEWLAGIAVLICWLGLVETLRSRATTIIREGGNVIIAAPFRRPLAVAQEEVEITANNNLLIGRFGESMSDYCKLSVKSQRTWLLIPRDTLADSGLMVSPNRRDSKV